LKQFAYGRLCPPAPVSRQGFAPQSLAEHFIPVCFQQKANWYGGGEAAARKFLKNQALSVFQKTLASCIQTCLNATWYQV
jgi:hypothetical protein